MENLRANVMKGRKRKRKERRKEETEGIRNKQRDTLAFTPVFHSASVSPLSYERPQARAQKMTANTKTTIDSYVTVVIRPTSFIFNYLLVCTLVSLPLK